METHIATTPFGRRPMSLAMLQTQKESRGIPEGKAVDKWQAYRDLCEGKVDFGITDRSLAVLAALLSFYPDNELSEENDLVVFPSNRQLILRAHGMSEPTLRRHLAALVESGLIIRRDSPNGKRYARKGSGEGFEEAFGFSLAPVLARADEFSEAAERVRLDNRTLRLIRERITLHRRDIGKLIEAAVEEDVAGDWGGLWKRFRAVVDAIPRRGAVADLESIVVDLAAIREEIDSLLEIHLNAKDSNGNDDRYERQQSNSNTELLIELEPALEESGAAGEPYKRATEPPKGYPLGFVLKACPEIAEYALDGIRTWRDLMATAAQVRGYLGISPSAYADALDVMGQENVAIVIACILQRAQHINSAGGYLRALTEKARAGEFTVGPMLMAAFKTNGQTSRMTG